MPYSAQNAKDFLWFLGKFIFEQTLFREFCDEYREKMV